jgi:hypothetical protein
VRGFSSNHLPFGKRDRVLEEYESRTKPGMPAASDCSYLVSVNITNHSHHIVQFSISKTAYELGECVECFFNFANFELPCYQARTKLFRCNRCSGLHITTI